MEFLTLKNSIESQERPEAWSGRSPRTGERVSSTLTSMHRWELQHLREGSVLFSRAGEEGPNGVWTLVNLECLPCSFLGSLSLICSYTGHLSGAEVNGKIHRDLQGLSYSFTQTPLKDKRGLAIWGLSILPPSYKSTTWSQGWDLCHDQFKGHAIHLLCPFFSLGSFRDPGFVGLADLTAP